MLQCTHGGQRSLPVATNFLLPLHRFLEIQLRLVASALTTELFCWPIYVYKVKF